MSTTPQYDPDNLLKDINQSIMLKGLTISVLVHAVVIFGTSFSLYKDWQEYGVKAPSYINVEKKKQKREAEEAARIAAAEARDAQRAADAAKAAESAPASSNAPSASGTSLRDDPLKALESEILPPIKKFELDDFDSF